MFDRINIKQERKQKEGEEEIKMPAFGTLSFTNCVFSRATFFRSHLEKIRFRSTTIEQTISFEDTYIECPDREYFRVRKNEYLKQNNRIEAMTQHVKELKEYRKELKTKHKKLKKI